MTKKKIGLMIFDFHKGGAERVVSLLTVLLQDRYDVHLMLMDPKDPAYELQGTLIDLSLPKAKNLFEKAQHLIKRIHLVKAAKQTHQLQLVISFLDIPNLINVLSKTPGCATAISIRNYKTVTGHGKNYLAVLQAATDYFYPKADAIVSLSKLIALHTQKRLKLDPKKIRIIYNPVPLSEIVARSLDVHPIPIQKEPSLMTFVSMGRMQSQKGTWHLLKAFHQVHQAHPLTRLILIGHDYSHGKVTGLIRELHLEEAVVLTGQLDNPYPVLALSDIYVLSSLSEGFSNALVEAMACGCTVVAADCKSSPREILSPESPIEMSCQGIEKAPYGILTTAFDQSEDWRATVIEKADQDLAMGMIELIQDPSLCQHYQHLSPLRAADFDPQISQNAFSQLIEDLT